MSGVLFVAGLLAWVVGWIFDFKDGADVGCLLLALAWLFHDGSPDNGGDDDGGTHRYA